MMTGLFLFFGISQKNLNLCFFPLFHRNRLTLELVLQTVT